MEDLGGRFWLWLAGVCIAGAIVLFVLTLLLLHAIYAWGIFGGLLVLAVLALSLGWIHDRREARRHQGSY